jgi:hypothetical protein
MFGIRTRMLAAIVAASMSSPVALMAQWGAAQDCSCSAPQQYFPAPAQVVSTACQCMQPVTQMVSRQMQVTELHPEQRVEKRAVQRVKWVQQEATAYRQVMDTKVVEVPTVSYQPVTEMQTRTINKSRWQTITQPVPKMASCQYDNRPGMMASMNRMGYTMRTAFQPNFVTHRQFIPQVCQCKVPVQKMVAVQSTRQQTVSTARMEPYKTTQQVAQYYTDYEDYTVTAMVPKTVMKTVMEARTTMAFVDPHTGMAIAPQGTQTAAEPTPTPTRAAENDTPPATGTFKGTSIPKPITNRLVSKSTNKPVKTAIAAADNDGWKAHTPASKVQTTPKGVMGNTTIVSK